MDAFGPQKNPQKQAVKDMQMAGQGRARRGSHKLSLLQHVLYFAVVTSAGFAMLTGLWGWHYWGITPRPLDYYDHGKAFWGSVHEPRLEKILARSAGPEASVWSVSAEGYTALHRAARRGTGRSVALLIDFGLDPEAQTLQGSRPLHEAVKAGNFETARALIGAGADVNARTQNAETPLHFMRRALLLSQETNAQTWGFLGLLLAQGADPNAQNDSGHTLLYDVSSRYVFYPEDEMLTVQMARMLLEAGADPAIATKSGDTPRAVAAERENEALLALLEQYGP